MLRDYRQRTAEYLAAINQDSFYYWQGARRRRERLALFRDHRDLFTPEVIGELREWATEAWGTERAGVARLLAMAIDGRTVSVALEIEAEILRQLDDPRVQAEPGILDDLFVERDEGMARAAVELGFRDLLQLRTEIHGIDYAGLAATGERLLARTEALLHQQRTRGRYNIVGSPAGRTRSELQRLSEAPLGARHFPHQTRSSRQAEFLTGLGYRPSQQAAVQLFALPALPNHLAATIWPTVWTLQVPEDIRLGVYPVDGRFAERAFWQASGAAQLAAWTSPGLATEFRDELPAGDQAGRLAWGLLFGNLLLDPRWLTGSFGYAESGDFRDGLAALRLLELRLAAAQLIYEVEYLGGRLAGPPVVRYQELLTRALGVEVDPGDYRRRLGQLAGPGLLPPASAMLRAPSLLGVADLLRAAAFESQCREYLKSLGGAAWWTSRKVGDLLVDLWNTGQRHPVEELAKLVGFGPLDYDWLIDELWRENND